MIKSEAYFTPSRAELQATVADMQRGQGARLSALAPLLAALPDAAAPASPAALVAWAQANPTPYLPPAEKGSPWEIGAAAGRAMQMLLALAAHAATMSDADAETLARAIYEHAEYLYCFNVTRDITAKYASATLLTLAGFALRHFAVAADWRLVGECRLLSMLDPTPQRLQEPGLAAAARLWRGTAGLGAFRVLDHPQYGPFLKKVVETVGDWAVADGTALIPEWAEYYEPIAGRPLRVAAHAHLRLPRPAAGEPDSFWDALNLETPELEGVRTALARGEQEAAKTAYLEYVGRLTALADDYLRDRGSMVDMNEPESRNEVEEICQNILVLRAHMHVRHDYGPVVDWTTILFDDLESNVSINGHVHMVMLAQAYRQTGDAKYLHHLVRLLRSWYESAPLPNRWQPLLQWRTLEVGARSGQQWPTVLLIAAREPIFRDGFLFDMCKSYLEHGRYLLAHQAASANNWFQVETGGLLVTGLLFPEFKESERFLQCGIRRMEWINRECFLPDGFQSEGSTAYHSFPVRGIGNVYELSKLLSHTLTPTYEDEFERMMDLYVYLAMPNLTLPWLNDCSPSIISCVEHAKLAAKLFPDRVDLRWVATQRAEGAPPPVTSFAFPYAGYYVMRDSWDPDAVYLVFDAGYYGSGHQHEDKLSLMLHAYGRTLIIDPSIYQYKQDEFEPYWRGSRGHQSVIIDGKGQNRRLLMQPEPRPDPDTIWIPGADADFCQGWFREGYATRTPGLQGREADLTSLDKSLQHTRAIFYVKGEYAVLSDLVLGSGVHQVEQVWHLAPIIAAPNEAGVYAGTYETTPDNIVRTTDAGMANIAIIPLPDPRLLLRVETGRTDPVIGWTALYKKCPSHDATYALNARLPLVLTDVLYPQRPGEIAIPAVTPLTVQAEDAATVTALQVRHGEFTDTFALSLAGPQQMSWGSTTFRGRALWLRRDRAGQIVRRVAITA